MIHLEKDKIKTDTSGASKPSKKACSKCNKEINKGEFFIRSVLSGEIICSTCDDNRVIIKGENFFSID